MTGKQLILFCRKLSYLFLTLNLSTANAATLAKAKLAFCTFLFYRQTFFISRNKKDPLRGLFRYL